MTSRKQSNNSKQEEIIPPVSFAGDLCTFDLKFAESGDECFTQSSELFGRSQSPFDQVVDADGDHRTLTKKRKMDKEGFVTPATPDIPKSSLYYSCPDLSDFRNQRGETKEGYSHVDSENSEDGYVHQLQKLSEVKSDQAGDLGAEEKSSSQDLHKHKLYSSASDMFEDMAQSTKMLIIEMAQTFRDSEEYEAMSLHRVETMLEEAKSAESSLRYQKELLQQRLFLISQHLDETSQ